MRNFKSKPLSATPNLPLTGETQKKNFIKVKENFKCEKCGYEVAGDGYTDHCPKCLWGKHVDGDIPGDRASECRGLMEPIRAKFLISNFKFQIEYKCTKCRHEFMVRSSEGDDREKLMELTNI